LPVLYVLLTIRGSEKSFFELLFLVLGSLATTGVILLSLLPVAWFFSLSLDNIAILAFLNLVFIFLSIVFGLFFLSKGIYYVGAKKTEGTKREVPKTLGVLVIFTILFLIVSLQMKDNLRPFFKMTEGYARIELKEEILEEDFYKVFGKHEFLRVCQKGVTNCYNLERISYFYVRIPSVANEVKWRKEILTDDKIKSVEFVGEDKIDKQSRHRTILD
jgi:hypothetical protein